MPWHASRCTGGFTTCTPIKAAMRILSEAAELVPVGSLTRHPENPRQGDIGAIHQSIEVNGFYGTIVAQRSTGRILAGNHRYEAAKHAGATEVPVAWVDVDDEAALRILLADNRTNDLASYDQGALADMLTALLTDTGTLDGTGYDGDALDELLAELGREAEGGGEDPGPQIDRAAELQEQWGTERGQIWAIPSKTVPGKSHRLMCGDSTSEEDVGRLLDGAEPRLMVTDPPYGVDYDPGWRLEAEKKGLLKSGTRSTGKVQNDNRADWSEAWALFPGAVAYVWHAGNKAHAVAESITSAGFEMRGQIIWAKPMHVISRGHYHGKHEPCWYAVRKGKTAEWVGDRKQTTLWEINNATIATGGRTAEDEGFSGHGTQKPNECMARPIRNHKGDVYDPFLGSGTTMIAAEQLRRTCYGMEIDPMYVAVILERLSGMGLEPHRVTRDEA